MRTPAPVLTTMVSGLSPQEFARQLRGCAGVVVVHGGWAGPVIVAAEPFLRFRSWGSRCELRTHEKWHVQFGNPWRVLDDLLARYELPDQPDIPFPLGGCFGVWGYDLKNFLEPRLTRLAVKDLELPDCDLGFYHSLMVFDDAAKRLDVVATGLQPDGSRTAAAAKDQTAWWLRKLGETREGTPSELDRSSNSGAASDSSDTIPSSGEGGARAAARTAYLGKVQRAKTYIRAGDIYQVNLAHRLSARWSSSAWDLFEALGQISPAPFSFCYDAGEYQVVSASPELFLRLSGRHILTQPIKGTRPRDSDATRDAQLAFELQTSPKEIAELLMITDLLRNDLGRVCEYGSVHVPDLMRLERFAQVQHLVSTVEGRLRPEITHFQALAACFPGGSITGAPKIRAMEIIDELEAVARGPYTGALGYLGFNHESQLAVAIRTGVLQEGTLHVHAGAGIVADSDPESEFEETLAKVQAFLHVAASNRVGQCSAAY